MTIQDFIDSLPEKYRDSLNKSIPMLQRQRELYPTSWMSTRLCYSGEWITTIEGWEYWNKVKNMFYDHEVSCSNKFN